MLAKALALTLFAAVAAMLAACSDDDPLEHHDLGPIFLDAGANESGVLDTGTGTDAKNDAVGIFDSGPDGAAAVELPSLDCPPLNMPPLDNPLDTLTAVALTQTRLYAASSSEIRAFERSGACAGTPATGFGTGGTLQTAAFALAAGPADTLIVSRREGTLLLDATGAVAASCSDVAARALSVVPELGGGYAVLAGPALARLVVTTDKCDFSGPVRLPEPLFALHAATPFRHDAYRALLAVQPMATEPPAVFSLDTVTSTTLRPPDGAPRPCSVRALVDTHLGVATLDSTCGKVRWLDVASGAEGYVHTIPEGALGRALVAVPGSAPLMLTLATVSDAGKAPMLRTITVVAP